MKIRLIAIGGKMPQWVTEGYNEYAKRLPPEVSLELVELPLGHRGKGADLARAKRQEGDQMLAAIPKGDRVVALEVGGKSWSTEQLAGQLESWQMDGRNVSLLVGGPDGLDGRCVAAADQKWSLSSLTLPHPLVRVLLSEQIYRACTILQGHPYHK
ncbi:23S rRNA (pseudouridine(1915)-N(3))-methyltransferase RlmH [Marinobacterium arenosum]|uniref:23S rRNA (pseudouridine(1915)-N(3))-methyltransferase RlmH n=1 Tax=Marinobacterium arenosum TaxID=2862496 RepID=UPI001C97261E|nr:23S rRNA (pseudouridine(1915)-N(3))-methyltransferase RlmH [Marinobacterium arenosum]MBY4676206.1 23S rRNA (pseudouridine(1915)-N(3))-methyltransferase RlmH [Marinobacterium arenosum]